MLEPQCASIVGFLALPLIDPSHSQDRFGDQSNFVACDDRHAPDARVLAGDREVLQPIRSGVRCLHLGLILAINAMRRLHPNSGFKLHFCRLQRVGPLQRVLLLIHHELVASSVQGMQDV